MSELRRIGRAPNPAELGLQLVVENEEVLERVGQNLLGSVNGLVGRDLKKAWIQLPLIAREGWKQRALELLREYVQAYETPTPPDNAGPTGRKCEPDTGLFELSPEKTA